MKLTENEKRNLIELIEKNKTIPEQYRFKIFENQDEIELLWDGKSNEITNVNLPFQIIEHVDEPRKNIEPEAQGNLFDTRGRKQLGWTNKLIWGNNSLVLSSLINGNLREDIENQGGLKFIYIDPPFDVGADFSMDINIGENFYEKKPNVLEHIAYRDTWGLGKDSYLSMIYQRLILLRDLLSDDGSIYVHCDYHLDNRMRGLLEEVFGVNNFISHIIWKRTGARSQSKFINPVTDSIFLYAKSSLKDSGSVVLSSNL